MVIGEKFAWGHLPKTGGEATRTMFDLFPELIVFADPVRTLEQYTSFKDRQEMVAGKQLVLNIRRLPAWILSHENHKARIPAYPHPKPDPISSPEQMASSTLPDQCLSNFTDNGRLSIDRWLRMESLAEDLLELVMQLTNVTDDRRQRVLRIDHSNSLDYDHDPHHWFTRDRLERLYRNNPNWSTVEQAVYGDTMLSDPST
jgi:hypothetical protein